MAVAPAVRAVPLAHRVLGAALRAAAFVLRRSPSLLAYAVADVSACALLAFVLLHERKVRKKGRGLFRNLRIAFRGSLTPSSRRRLVVAWARHMTWLVVDFFRMPRITPANLERAVDMSDLPKVRALLAEGKGVIFVSGHAGLWELCGHCTGLVGLKMLSVARPIPIAPVQQLVTGIRTVGGQDILSKWGVLRPIKAALEKGGVVGLVVDENARRKAVFVPFLGTLAATHTSPALLHYKTGAPIMVATVNRLGRERFKLHVWRILRRAPLDGEGVKDRQAQTRAIMAEVNAGLTEAIRTYPEQWFWGSRRFLTRPPGEVPGPDGLPPACVDQTGGATHP